MHFWINEKLTTGLHSAGLISKVSEKYAAKTLKIAVLDNPTVV